MPTRIVSGGQTGVDRAALDVALHLGIPCGGWCPQGRRAEDGPIAEVYPLQETSWWGYPQRTEWNVRDSDATLILTRGPVDGGTALTSRLAEKLRRPCLILDLTESIDIATVQDWLVRHHIQTLNVAGPRESNSPGIHTEAMAFLTRLLTCVEPAGDPV